MLSSKQIKSLPLGYHSNQSLQKIFKHHAHGKHKPAKTRVFKPGFKARFQVVVDKHGKRKIIVHRDRTG